MIKIRFFRWEIKRNGKTQTKHGSDKLLYGINDKPKLATQILFGFQTPRFGGIIAVPLVISSALGLDGATSTPLSATILASGIATIIQSKGIGRIGTKPLYNGDRFYILFLQITVGAVAGLPGIIGATILGSIVEIVLSFLLNL